MKFSFATAILTLTAASAVVFAAPESAASDPTVFGEISFDGFKVEGTVLGKKFEGRLKFPVPYEIKVEHAAFTGEHITQLDSSFIGSDVDGFVSIKYPRNGGTIVGRAQHGHRGHVILEGATHLV